MAFEPRTQQQPQIRINYRIRVPEVLVIGPEGNKVGILPTSEAVKLAQDMQLDLVEVSPKAQPPVCKILDFGKFKYEEKKKANLARKNQHVVELKEIKLRPKTDDHDIAFKVRNARGFIEDGHRVKFTVRFRGREITHPDEARKQIDALMKYEMHEEGKVIRLEDICVMELRPAIEARAMSCIVAPKKS
jgi:translation initiation factor IF-3